MIEKSYYRGRKKIKGKIAIIATKERKVSRT